jgi:ABC-type dipeptide/oligopeptide/nickel transport system permease subunit
VSGSSASRLTRFRKNRGAVVGASLVLFLVAFAWLAPLFSSHDPNVSDFARGVRADTGTPVGPSSAFWLGADRIFRDEFVRLAFGARLSLLIGISATAIASALGAVVGIIAGYNEGKSGFVIPWPVPVSLTAALALAIGGHSLFASVIIGVAVVISIVAMRSRIGFLRAGVAMNFDIALMRLVDVGLSFPFLLLVMAVGSAVDRTSVASILMVLGLTGWLGTARLVRAKTMQIRSRDFVLAARGLGAGTGRILFRHILPNIAGPLIVVSTVSVAQMILAESVLSYLGVGISPPTPTWGHMLFEGQDYYAAAPWLVVAPGAAILIAVFGFNLLGEGLRDALDPRDA